MLPQREPENLVTARYLEDRLRMLDLENKIDSLQKKLDESKSKPQVLIPISSQSQDSAIQTKPVESSASSMAPISREAVVEKKRIPVQSISSVQLEIDLLHSRLNRIIASTQATMISRRRVVKITNNFQQPIGRGGFGQVFKGTWANQQVAVKEIRPPWRCSTAKETQSFAKMIQREVEALSAVQHPNIIQLLGICTETDSIEGNSGIGVSLIFDYANGGTLFDCLFGDRSNSTLDISQMLLIARHVIAALDLLHSTNVNEEPDGSVMVHRDVKSANILLHRDEKGAIVRAVLADFGLARFNSDLNSSHSQEGPTGLPASSMTAVVGTHGYVDPLYAETSEVAPSQDIYAYGVILFEMLWKERPETMLARRVRQSKIEDSITKAKTVHSFKETVELKRLVTIGKLCVSMENRPTAIEIRKSLGF